MMTDIVRRSYNGGRLSVSTNEIIVVAEKIMKLRNVICLSKT
jgi:hypothetical protein